MSNRDLRLKPVRHGLSKTPEHRAWRNMRNRCLCKTHFAYHRYGGRGITICPEWDEFLVFLADMGKRPEGTSLDRIDNSKGYSKDNCRWATKLEQNNNRRSNHDIIFYGTRTTISQLARRFGINKGTLKDRINAGWDIRDAILRPSQMYKPVDLTKQRSA